MKLIERRPQRLFAFGCSFTQYGWATWPEIVAYDLDIPMYNLGRAGAGNQYIANIFAQANEIYHFNSDDLIMICWSGYMREDRWFDGNWQVAGDISSNNVYDQQFINKYVDPLGLFLRDFASFSLTKRLLESIGCQHHMFSMSELWRPESDHHIYDPSQQHITDHLQHTYGDLLSTIMPSFFEVLWESDIHRIKSKQQTELWNDKFSDWHPLIYEHFDYLKLIFDEHKFRPETAEIVAHTQQRFNDYVYDNIRKLNGEIFDTVKMPDHEREKLSYLFHIVTNQPYPPGIVN